MVWSDPPRDHFQEELWLCLWMEPSFLSLWQFPQDLRCLSPYPDLSDIPKTLNVRIEQLGCDCGWSHNFFDFDNFHGFLSPRLCVCIGGHLWCLSLHSWLSTEATGVNFLGYSIWNHIISDKYYFWNISQTNKKRQIFMSRGIFSKDFEPLCWRQPPPDCPLSAGGRLPSLQGTPTILSMAYVFPIPWNLEISVEIKSWI